MNGISGKIAIVTGASGGMGRTVALKLAELGASVTVVDITEQTGKETVQLIEDKGGKAIFVKADVSSSSDVKNYVEQTVRAFGKVDLFFNNAGIVGAGGKLADLSVEQIDKVLDINLKGAMYGMKYVIPEMLKAGGGAIVSTSSGAGLTGVVGLTPYTASKHGVAGFTKAAALDYARDNIRINAVAPGSTATPIIKDISPEGQKAIEASIPMGRLGRVDEIANLVAYLLSDDSTYITGAIIPIDGAYTAQ